MSLPYNIGGYVVELEKKPKKNHSNRHHLRLFDDTQEVAFVNFNFDDEHIWVYDIRIQEDFRRRGIASEIYDVLQSYFGCMIKFQRTAIASPAMRCFFEKYISSGTIVFDDGNTLILSKEDDI